MPTTDLSIIIDPGGIPDIRPGINLQVFPSGSTPLQRDSETLPTLTANQALAFGGFDDIQQFTFEAYLTATQFNSVQSLDSYNKSAKRSGDPFEVVIYNLVEPYTETVANRTRFKVPGTDILEETDLGTLTKFTYWIALQGYLGVNWEQYGILYKTTFTFLEGTRLTSAME